MAETPITDVLKRLMTELMPRGTDFESAMWGAASVVAMLGETGLLVTAAHDAEQKAAAWDAGVDARATDAVLRIPLATTKARNPYREPTGRTVD